MYNRSKTGKPSKVQAQAHHDKAKTIRNSALKTPNHLEGPYEQRSPHLSKFKSLPSKGKRHTTASLLPTDALSSDN